MRKKRGNSPLFLFLLFEIYFLKFEKRVDFWCWLWYTIFVVKGKAKEVQNAKSFPIDQQKKKRGNKNEVRPPPQVLSRS